MVNALFNNIGTFYHEEQDACIRDRSNVRTVMKTNLFGTGFFNQVETATRRIE
jgi:hypothetical protein